MTQYNRLKSKLSNSQLSKLETNLKKLKISYVVTLASAQALSRILIRCFKIKSIKWLFAITVGGIKLKL